jgi:CHAD domain-containing protein
MSPRPADSRGKNTPPEALERFLKRVLVEQLALCDSLAPDPVHDLRVALRRCRSLAEGFGALDDHRVWRRLHKSAKELQDDVAGLRDAQVMASRIRRLRIAGGAAGEAVAEALRRDERKAKRKAQRAVEDFPRKRWKRWRRRLLQRAEQIDAAPASFAHLVLERLREAAARERRWRESGSQVAAHSLRIAVKRLRYTVQSFLPEQYAAWENTLKRMQDALGDIHDLDVLRAWLQKVAKRKSLDHQTVHLWMKRIAETRRERVERYKQAVSTRGKSAVRTSHAPALWDRWRHEIERLAEPSSPASGEASA